MYPPDGRFNQQTETLQELPPYPMKTDRQNRRETARKATLTVGQRRFQVAVKNSHSKLPFPRFFSKTGEIRKMNDFQSIKP
jgi:hypothetical protein